MTDQTKRKTRERAALIVLALFLLGLASITAGAYLYSPALGYLAGGVSLLVCAALLAVGVVNATR